MANRRSFLAALWAGDIVGAGRCASSGHPAHDRDGATPAVAGVDCPFPYSAFACLRMGFQGSSMLDTFLVRS
jgi:hypothetical protein